jgi:hypothetical protein
MLLLVWAVAAYFLLPIAWRVATRHHPAVVDMPRIAVTANRIHLTCEGRFVLMSIRNRRHERGCHRRVNFPSA